MSILDEYKKLLEEEKENEPMGCDVSGATDAELSEWEKELSEEDKKAIDERYNELKNHPLDPMNKFRAYQYEYPTIKEEDFKDIKKEEVKTVIIHAYCPKCGKEIVSKTPVMYNPYTGDRICKYECECGMKCNLEHAYPRVAYINENGEEVKGMCE